MIDDNTLFLLDTSIIIKTANEFYHPERSITFWDELYEQIKAGTICILKAVSDELIWQHMKPEDAARERFVSKWSRTHVAPYAYNQDTDADIYNNVQEVFDYLKTGPYYPNVHTSWSLDNADPWLIAAGMTYPNCTVVTDETTQGPLAKKDRLKEAKIPFVCEHFGVKYTRSIYDVMSQLHIVADAALRTSRS